MVSIPCKDETRSKPSIDDDKEWINEEPANDYSLAASIQLFPKSREHEIRPRPRRIYVPHICTGKTGNNITVWVRTNESDTTAWNIFSFDVDFSRPLERWFEFLGLESLEGEDGIQVPPPEVHRRTWYLDNMFCRPEPAPPGRRFIWSTKTRIPSKGLEETAPSSLSNTLSQSTAGTISETQAPPRKYKLQLWTSHVEYLPLIPNDTSLTGSYLSDMVERWRRVAVHELEVPEEYGVDEETDYSFSTSLEEKCGSVISILSTGDIWVFRYGHD